MAAAVADGSRAPEARHRLHMRLEAQDLSLAYGDVVALRNLTAEINGGVLGVLGATASGKTSLLQIIAGQIAPSGGELRIDGQVVQPTKHRDVAYVPQDAGAFPYFQRPKETMTLALSLKGIKASDYPDQFLDALGLGGEDRTAAGYPSAEPAAGPRGHHLLDAPSGRCRRRL